MPDVFDDFRERVSGIARQRARALIREVRRRPDALVTKRYEDSHTGEPFDETTTCVSSPRSTSRTRASTVSHVSAR